MHILLGLWVFLGPYKCIWLLVQSVMLLLCSQFFFLLWISCCSKVHITAVSITTYAWFWPFISPTTINLL